MGTKMGSSSISSCFSAVPLSSVSKACAVALTQALQEGTRNVAYVDRHVEQAVYRELQAIPPQERPHLRVHSH